MQRGQAGERELAITYSQQRLAIARELGDHRAEEQALASLGVAYDALGDYQAAVNYYEQRLSAARTLGGSAPGATSPQQLTGRLLCARRLRSYGSVRRSLSSLWRAFVTLVAERNELRYDSNSDGVRQRSILRCV
ncbi:MAG: tetratricopeptide repeat protein [Spirulinaceae cyanobacterium RM2_2_10]|nr:tetratricopeptide repeat protein [Spirulinaceae cyanobacterium RM2_2_10]